MRGLITHSSVCWLSARRHFDAHASFPALPRSRHSIRRGGSSAKGEHSAVGSSLRRPAPDDLSSGKDFLRDGERSSRLSGVWPATTFSRGRRTRKHLCLTWAGLPWFNGEPKTPVKKGKNHDCYEEVSNRRRRCSALRHRPDDRSAPVRPRSLRHGFSEYALDLSHDAELGHGSRTSCDGAMVRRHIELGRRPCSLSRQGVVIPGKAGPSNLAAQRSF